MQRNEDYYDPSTPEGNDDGMVLKPIVFKPLKNTKTGNFFSYAFGVINRNKSINADNEIQWVHGAPAEIQRKVDAVRELHEKIVKMYVHLKKIAKKGTALQKEEMEEKIAEVFLQINQVIYPDNEREFIESKEAKRFRQEQLNELTLDAQSIAALTGKAQPAMGSTADASIAQAKLENALAQIKELEEQDSNQELIDAQSQIAEMQAELDKPPSRRKAGFKPTPEQG